MRTYRITIQGQSDLLMHADNIEWSDTMKRWREDPNNKAVSVPGDDRSPAFTWIGGLYHDGASVTIPSDLMMRCLMEGGAQVIVKGRKTFKSQTQSGMVVVEEHWPLLLGGKPVPVAPIMALTKEAEFQNHCVAAKAQGFVLYVKRVGIGDGKHIRVRPRFHNWATVGTLQVWDQQITLTALRSILTAAGSYKGLGDWRPGAKTPGPFGRFTAEIEEIANG